MSAPQNYATLGPELLARGFEPIPVEGKAPKIKGWQDIKLHPDQVKLWAENGRGGNNVGIRTANLAAVDIDVYDAEVSALVAEEFQKRFGRAPLRIGMPPKRLLLYAAKQPGPKVTSVLFTTPDGLEHRVEVLGVGQQFVAYGIHPDSGRHYTWPEEDLVSLERWELPVVDRDEVAAWVNHDLVSLLMGQGFRPRYERGDSSLSTGVATFDADDPFDAIKSRHDDVDLAALRVLLDALDQDKCDDRDSWRNVIFAVHHQFHGTEDELEALELVDEWSSKSVKYVTGVVPAIWENAHEQRTGGLVTVGTLKTWAGDAWKAYLAQRKAETSVAVVEEQGWEARIATADRLVLEGQIIPEIRAAVLSDVTRIDLAGRISARARALGVSLSKGEAKRLIAPPRVHTTVEDPENAPDIEDWTSTAPEWARGWIWVRTDGKWINRKTKLMVTKQAFDTEMQRYVVDLTVQEGDELTTYEASQRMFKHWGARAVDKDAYHPGLAEVFTIGGVTYVNKYRPELRIQPAASWNPVGQQMARAIERHLSLLIPDRRNRQLFRAWLAHQYLHPGVKVRWAPLLKGCPGDGKSLFGELLELVLGVDNVKLMNADTIQTSPFSGWVEGQCVTVFEEVKFHGHNRYDVVNKLKPYISNNRVEKHGKGKDPGNILNVTNYLMLTNHEDAIPIEEGDRRYFVLFSPFRVLADMDQLLQADYLISVADHFEELISLVRENPDQLALWLAETEFPEEWDANMSAPMTEAKQKMVGNAVSAGEAVIDDILEDVADGGRRLGISADVVCLDLLKAEVRNETDDRRPIADKVVAARLSLAGYRPLPGGEKGKARKLRWRDKLRSVWSRGGADITNARVCELLDATVGAFAD